jgi:hypothetical protein
MKEAPAISSASELATADGVKRPAYSSAAEAADAMQAATIAYLVDKGVVCTLDSLLAPVPEIGRPIFPIARSTAYSIVAAGGQFPVNVFRCGRRLLCSTAEVLRLLQLDEKVADRRCGHDLDAEPS